MDILRLRKSKGLSQMALAKKVGVSLQSIVLWENEVGKPNEENARKLFEVLGKSNGIQEETHFKPLSQRVNEAITKLEKNKEEYLKYFSKEMERLQSLSDMGATEVNVGVNVQAKSTILTKDGKDFVFNSRTEAGRFIGSKSGDVRKAMTRGGRIKGYTVSEGPERLDSDNS